MAAPRMTLREIKVVTELIEKLRLGKEIVDVGNHVVSKLNEMKSIGDTTIEMRHALIVAYAEYAVRPGHEAWRISAYHLLKAPESRGTPHEINLLSKLNPADSTPLDPESLLRYVRGPMPSDITRTGLVWKPSAPCDQGVS